MKEIEQFLEFQLQQERPFILNLSSEGELSLVVQDTNRKLISIDQKIAQTFSSDQVMTTTSPFDKKGLEKFSSLISPHIPSEDVPAMISLKRLARMSNSIMVMDDDAMVVKQMEKILGGLGHVIVLQDHKEFLESYKYYAPNIVFLDIHLRDGVYGPNFMDTLLGEVDPYAHVIIISSDTAMDTVQKIKTKGVKGFAVKPFDRNKLFKHVMSAPTFIPRNQ